MVNAGILSERDRVELIEGEILAMSPIGPPHGAALDRATRAMFTIVADKAIVRVQGSVGLGEYNEPQPDIVLMRPKDDFYAKELPGPSDILLIVEIAQSSLEYDRTIKARIYAERGFASTGWPTSSTIASSSIPISAMPHIEPCVSFIAANSSRRNSCRNAVFRLKPFSHDQQTAASRQRPAASRQRPAASRQRPADSGQRPADSGQRPADSGQRTAASGQRPADSGQQIAASRQRAAGRCPLTLPSQSRAPKTDSPRTSPRDSSNRSGN